MQDFFLNGHLFVSHSLTNSRETLEKKWMLYLSNLINSNYISMAITQPKGTKLFTIDEIDFDKKDL